MHLLFTTIPHLTYEISGRKKFLYIYNLSTLVFFAFITKFLLQRFEVKLYLVCHGKKHNVFLRRFSDLVALKEAFSDKEYNWFPITDINTVIDLGACIGDTALYYHCKFPTAAILAVEPSKESFELLRKNTEGIKNIQVQAAAIGPETKVVQLYLRPGTLGDSLQKRPGTSLSESAQQITLEELFLETSFSKPVDLIKCDVEGSEFEIFNDIVIRDFTKACIGEFHEDLSGRSIDEFRQLFEKDFDIVTTPLARKGRYLFRAVLK